MTRNSDSTQVDGLLSRRAFTLLAAGALAATATEAQSKPKVLAVVAHPDDEYAFAVLAYRIVHELGGIVDQIVITNGEGGYKYSTFAEAIYGSRLTNEATGRSHLPAIRKEETLAAGHIIGIRQHYFLDQKDGGYTEDPAEALHTWDQSAVRTLLAERLAAENYDFVLTLLPNAETHGHHKAATLLALNAISSLPEERRPAILAAEPYSSHESPRQFTELAGHAVTRTDGDVYELRRSQPVGYRDSLNHQIIANWVIAAHKSQGLFQMDAGRHDVERFWRFEIGGAQSKASVQALFEHFNSQWKR